MTPTRLHITVLYLLAVAVWWLALWRQGVSALEPLYFTPFGLVVTVSMVALAIFNRHAWAWRIFRPWFVDRPDLRGTWRVTLVSNWVSTEPGASLTKVEGYMVVRQTFSSLTMRLLTPE